jgi:hypothetical protein
MSSHLDLALYVRAIEKTKPGPKRSRNYLQAFVLAIGNRLPLTKPANLLAIFIPWPRDVIRISRI